MRIDAGSIVLFSLGHPKFNFGRIYGKGPIILMLWPQAKAQNRRTHGMFKYQLQLLYSQGLIGQNLQISWRYLEFSQADRSKVIQERLSLSEVWFYKLKVGMQGQHAEKCQLTTKCRLVWRWNEGCRPCTPHQDMVPRTV